MQLKEIEGNDVFKRHFDERIVNDPILVIIFNRQVALFRKDRTNHKVADHFLHWDMQGLGAFSITKDIRVVYEETDGAFIFRDIGTHEQVYR